MRCPSTVTKPLVRFPAAEAGAAELETRPMTPHSPATATAAATARSPTLGMLAVGLCSSLCFCLEQYGPLMDMTGAEQVAVRLGPVAAGDRDVELRIAPHPVLGDVEARGLDVRL